MSSVRVRQLSEASSRRIRRSADCLTPAVFIHGGVLWKIPKFERLFSGSLNLGFSQ
jgi:hypothetical protein